MVDFVPDDPGSVGSGPGETNQINKGTISWETCIPELLWNRAGQAMPPGSLAGTAAILYSHEDWGFTGTYTTVWYLGVVEVRREVRTVTLLNNSLLTDTVEINYLLDSLSSSCISSAILTTSTYIADAGLPLPGLPDSGPMPRYWTARLPETILIDFKPSYFNQSFVVFDTVKISAVCTSFSVYRGSRNVGGVGGSPVIVPINDGTARGWSWEIYRDADGVGHGLAWEDCSGGGSGGGGSLPNCIYTEDSPPICTYSEDAAPACAYSEDVPPICTYTEG